MVKFLLLFNPLIALDSSCFCCVVQFFLFIYLSPFLVAQALLIACLTPLVVLFDSSLLVIWFFFNLKNKNKNQFTRNN
jgi:hypothetical protein